MVKGKRRQGGGVEKGWGGGGGLKKRWERGEGKLKNSEEVGS